MKTACLELNLGARSSAFAVGSDIFGVQEYRAGVRRMIYDCDAMGVVQDAAFPVVAKYM